MLKYGTAGAARRVEILLGKSRKVVPVFRVAVARLPHGLEGVALTNAMPFVRGSVDFARSSCSKFRLL